MACVEIENHDQVMVVRLNRPERMNALREEMRTGLAEAWCAFRDEPRRAYQQPPEILLRMGIESC